MKKLYSSFKEVITAVLPMTIIIFLLSVTIVRFDAELFVDFFVGTIFLTLGMTLFLFGSEFSMMEVGHLVGTYLMKKGKLWAVMLFGFLIGWAITIAEPDVQVLAEQVFKVSEGALHKPVLIMFVGVGVGIFIVIGVMRILFQKNLVLVLLCGYAVAFSIAALFTDNLFFPVAFDAGGVTTGPMTVPFILAFASGVTSVTRSKKDGNDSFGMIGLASLGPIIAVLILGGIYK